jgi:hypothetical protein
MEPPAALALGVSSFGTVTPLGNCEPSTLLTTGSQFDDVAVVQISVHDQIHLAPRVCGFFNAYLDADMSRRADFRNAVAYASHRFRFDPPATPSLQEDVAAALAIAQDAADIAYATNTGELIDGAGSGSAGSDLLLLADAFATLALGYRYVVGLYATDPTLQDIGEIAVRFVLLSECEDDAALAVTIMAAPASPESTRNVFRLNQEITSSQSIFVSPARGHNEGAGSSLEAISLGLKDRILLTA